MPLRSAFVAPVLAAVVAVACSARSREVADGAVGDGARTDAALPGDGAAHRPDGAVPAAARCRVERRGVVHAAPEHSAVQRIAVNGGDAAVLFFMESPRALHLGRMDLGAEAPRVSDVVPLAEIPVIQDTGLVAVGDGYVAAWTDFAEGEMPRLHVTRYRGGTVAGELVLPDTAYASGVSAGLTAGGRLLVVWSQQFPLVARWELRYALSDDGGETFTPAAVLSPGPEWPFFASIAAVPGGAAVVWVDRRMSPDHTTVRFARVAEDGTATPPAPIVDHGRYVYETSLAYGDGRLLLATTDSRADILTVPLYVSVLEPDGRTVREGIRLTSDFHHDHPGIAFDGASFGLVSVPFMNMAATNEQQVFVRQLDRDGVSRFDPVQVSEATLRESDCCVRANGSEIAAAGPGRHLVAWNQHEQRGDRLVFVIAAALLDCAAP